MKDFRSSIAFAAAISLSLGLPPSAQSALSLTERLHEAAVSTTLDAPGSIPFHLKLAVDILPQYKQPAQQGSVEIWWSAPDMQRIVYDLPDYHGISVRTAQGQLRTANVGASPYILDHLLSEVLHPIDSVIDPSKIRFEAVKRPFAKGALDCISLTLTDAKLYQNNPTIYCFDGQAQFRVEIENVDQYTLRRTTGTFGTRHVPLDLEYDFLTKPVARAHIDTLQAQKAAYPESSETAGLVPVPPPPPSVSGSVMSGHLVYKPDPIYPQDALRQHIRGTVLLHAIISANGTIQNLAIIGSPSDLLTASAVKAVRQWRYAPYLINGVPTEIATMITVDFTFGAP